MPDSERAVIECGYECPYTEAGHNNYNAGHDFVFRAAQPSAEPLGLTDVTDLVTLIRIGYLDGTERAAAIVAQLNPAMRDLLVSILKAKDVAEAVALASKPDRPTPGEPSKIDPLPPPNPSLMGPR